MCRKQSTDSLSAKMGEIGEEPQVCQCTFSVHVEHGYFGDAGYIRIL